VEREGRIRAPFENATRRHGGDTGDNRVSAGDFFSPSPLPSLPIPFAFYRSLRELTPTSRGRRGRIGAVELWDWHEQERVRRLLAGTHHKPRCATDKFLGPVLRLHTHVRKAYDCTEAEAWQRIRDYRDARLSETEAALRDSRPEASKWRSYAAGEAAWSHKGFDYLEQRGADPKAAKAQADAEYQAEVARLKAEKRGEVNRG
jgi:hypothetical protein